MSTLFEDGLLAARGLYERRPALLRLKPKSALRKVKRKPDDQKWASGFLKMWARKRSVYMRKCGRKHGAEAKAACARTLVRR